MASVSTWDELHAAVAGTDTTITITGDIDASGATAGDINIARSLTLCSDDPATARAITYANDKALDFGCSGSDVTVAVQNIIFDSNGSYDTSDGGTPHPAAHVETDSAHTITATFDGCAFNNAPTADTPPATAGSGLKAAADTDGSVVNVTCNNCSADGNGDDGFALYLQSGNTTGSATLTLNDCTSGTTTVNGDEAVSPHNKAGAAAGKVILDVNGGTFVGRFSPSTGHQTITIDDATITVPDAANNRTTPCFFGNADNTGHPDYTLTNCTITSEIASLANTTGLFSAKADAVGGQSVISVRQSTITLDGESLLCVDTAAGANDGIIEMWDCTVTSAASHTPYEAAAPAILVRVNGVAAAPPAFRAYRCVFDFSASAGSLNSQEGYGFFHNDATAGEITLEGCLLKAAPVIDTFIDYLAYFNSNATTGGVRNCTLIGNDTAAGQSNGIRIQPADTIVCYGNILVDFHTAIHSEPGASGYSDSGDGSFTGYNWFDANGTNVQNDVAKGTDDTATGAPGFEGGGDYSLAASANAEDFVPTAAYQIEKYALTVNGSYRSDKATYSPDLYNYGGTPDKETLISGKINAGAYNTPNATRDVTFAGSGGFFQWLGDAGDSRDDPVTLTMSQARTVTIGYKPGTFSAMLE